MAERTAASAARARVAGGLAFAPGWVYAIGWSIVRHGPPPATTAERDAHLARRLPLYPALQWLNRRHGGSYTVYVLGGERMVYFAEGRFLGDHAGLARFELATHALDDPRLLHRTLRALGVDHLLLPRDGPAAPSATPECQRWFREVFHDEAATLYALADRPRTRQQRRRSATRAAGPCPARAVAPRPGGGTEPARVRWSARRRAPHDARALRDHPVPRRSLRRAPRGPALGTGGGARGRRRRRDDARAHPDPPR